MASSAALSEMTNIGTLGTGLRALEQQQQALLSSVKMLKQKLESRPSTPKQQSARSLASNKAVVSSPSSETTATALPKQNTSGVASFVCDSDDATSDTSENDASISLLTSEPYIQFELIKKGYEIVETFFVGLLDSSVDNNQTASRPNTGSTLWFDGAAPLDLPLGQRSVSIVGTKPAARQTFTAPSTSGATTKQSVSSNSRVDVQENSGQRRDAKFIHTINGSGQHVFIVLDMNGVVSAAPCDPSIKASSSKSVSPELLEECDEYVRACNSSLVAVHGRHLCVYSRELDNQFRRQIFTRCTPETAANSESNVNGKYPSEGEFDDAATSNPSKIRSASFLDTDKFVKHYPIVRCSTVLSDPEKALQMCDTCIKALVQCSIRLSSKKMIALRSNARLLLANVERYESASQRFLNVTRKSLSFLQSVQDDMYKGNDDEGDDNGVTSRRNKDKVRFNIQKRLEYVTEFSESRHCFFNEALQTVAYLNGALEHLTSGTSEKADRMQYILEPAKPPSHTFSPKESVPTQQRSASAPVAENSGGNTRIVDKRSRTIEPDQQTNNVTLHNKEQRVQHNKKQSIQLEEDADDSDDKADDAILARQLASALAASSSPTAESSSSQRPSTNVPKSLRKFVSARKPQ